MSQHLDAKRLKWACRRGMLELDIFLGNFLEHVYASLSSQQKQCFVDLLTYPDPVLFAWLTGAQQPENPELQAMVTLIHATTVNRNQSD